MIKGRGACSKHRPCSVQLNFVFLTKFANFVLQDEEKYDDDSRDGHEEEEEGDHGKSEDEGEEGEFSTVEAAYS